MDILRGLHAMSEFAFVGAAYEAASPTQDDQLLVNWYCEIDSAKQAGERGVIALYPTPGLLSRVQLVVGEVRGFHVLPGGQTMIAVAGDTVYSITLAYVATVIGYVKSIAGTVYMQDNGVAVMITDGTLQRYSYIWSTGVFAILNDGAFDGANVCDEVDNFFIYNNPRTNQWGCSDAGDVASGALNVASVIGASGNLVTLIADHRQVLLMTSNYSERWVDVGTQPFPFAIVPGSSMQHGCAAQNSIARLGEGVAFLAQDTRGQCTVIVWGAAITTPQRISTFAIENAIQSYAVTSDAIGYTYTQAGHEFYMLTFPTEDVTWCYDLSTQLWHRRAWRDSYGVLHRHRSNCCAVFGDDIIVGDFENGLVYALSQSTYTDNGDPLPCIRRCRHLTSDLKRQFNHDLQIQFQPGIGLTAGQGSDPECILRWSNNGGFTFGNDHILKMGKAGEYRRRAIKRRLGQARDRVYEIEVTDPVYRVVVSANLNASVGAS